MWGNGGAIYFVCLYKMFGMLEYVSDNWLARWASVIGVQDKGLKDTGIGLVFGSKERKMTERRLHRLPSLPSTASYWS